MKGWIYIFSNPAFKENIIKIGKTSRTPKKRITEIDTTGVPDSFSLEYKALVKNYSSVEKHVHRNLDSFRVRKTREFFNCELNVAVTAIRQCSEIISEGFPSREFAEEMKRRDLELQRYKQEQEKLLKEELQEQERILKDELNKKVLEQRKYEALIKPKEFHELSQAGKFWRLYWSSGSTWIKSQNGFVNFILFTACIILMPIFGLGGSLLIMECGVYALPFGLIGILTAIKLWHLACVAQDIF
jgi:hypothetical protein